MQIINEDYRYGRYKGHEYRLLTSKSVQDIWNEDYHIQEVMYEEIDDLMNESIDILAKYGYDYNDDILDFRINFEDTDLVYMTIEEMFQNYVDKEGADLVAFDTGFIGFVFYRTNVIKSVEILGRPIEEV